MAKPIERHLPRAAVPLVPTIGRDVFLAASAEVYGDVRLGDGVSVWPGAVLRGDLREVIVGEGTNLQEHVLCHVANDAPCVIGPHCTIGHHAVIHGCTLEEGCLVGIGATILNGSVVGAGCIVAAGALVTEGTIVPPRSMVMGVPAKVRRPLDAEEAEQGRTIAAKYREIAGEYLRGMYRPAPGRRDLAGRTTEDRP